MEVYREHYLSAGPDDERLFPGAEAALRALREAGYRLAVATGKSRRGLDRALASTGLGELFEASRCADEAGSKPGAAAAPPAAGPCALGVGGAGMGRGLGGGPARGGRRWRQVR